jgi:GT2 family glycosyltransferase
MRKEDYLCVGGMSAVFPHSFNDVDLAFKVLAEGLRILWTPIAKIWHFESLSRDPRVREEEFDNIHARWGTHFGDDRYTRT